MAKTKKQKKEIINNIKDKIDRSKSIVFAKFNALTVKENEELRKELKSSQSEYFVAKKTLIDIAFNKSDIKGVDAKNFDGKIAAVFGYSDEVAPAKIIDKFQESHEGKIEFLGGVLEKKLMSQEEITALAKVPSKTELYAKIAGSLNAPVSGFVNALSGNLRNLVYVLKAIEEKK